MFKNLIRASFTGTTVNGDLLLPRVKMVLADHPKEGAMLCFKRRDSFLDCSTCSMPSRITQQNHPARTHLSSSRDEASSTGQGPRSVRNTEAQLSTFQHPHRDVVATVGKQLQMGTHGIQPFMQTLDIGLSRRWLVLYSAHEQPPALCAFTGLGSEPFHVYNVISFDIQQVFDLGIIRHFLISQISCSAGPVTCPFPDFRPF